MSEIRKRYVDLRGGVLRFESYIDDKATNDGRSPEQLSHNLADALGLGEEHRKLLEAIAEGTCCGTCEAMRWHLRKNKVANSRTISKEVHNALQRLQSQRL